MPTQPKKKRRLVKGKDYDGWGWKRYGSDKIWPGLIRPTRSGLLRCSSKIHYLDKAVKVKLVEVK